MGQQKRCDFSARYDSRVQNRTVLICILLVRYKYYVYINGIENVADRVKLVYTNRAEYTVSL